MFSNLLRLSRWLWLGLALFISHPVLALDANTEQDTYGLSMGSAVAAIAGGTHAIQWNPAGIARATVPMAQLGLGFNPTSSDLQLNTSVLYPFADGTVFALSQFSDFPHQPNSSTTYIGSVGLPLNSSRDLFLGLNIKYLALSMLSGGVQQNGRGLGLDLGVAYDLRNSQGTMASFGLAVKDVATDVRFDTTGEEAVTRTFVLGAAYQNIKDTRVEMDYDIIDQTLSNSTQHNRLRLGVERFFGERFYSVRLGYDDLFNNDGYFTFGAGYHPAQPFEISYALRGSVNTSQISHYLSFVYRFDHLAKTEKTNEHPLPSTSSSEINIGNTNTLVETPAETGKPVSGVPLRKMTIQVEPAAFSPSGKQKTTTISFPGDESPDISRWVIEIQAPNQAVVRRIGGTGPLLPFVAWDGVNEEGKAVPEGRYRVVLKTFGQKNEMLSNDFENVEVISARSRFELLSSANYFSTRAARQGKKELVFTVDPGGSRAVQTWDFEISDASSNKVIFESQGKNELPRTIRWNGRNSNHELVSDGNYLCLLIAQDKAGNSLKTDAVQVTIANTPPDLVLKGEDNWVDFSSKKEFQFDLDAADRIGIQNWKLRLLDENGNEVKDFVGSGQPPQTLAWTGQSAQGQMIPPGSLVTAEFQATDKAGNSATADPYQVQVDVPSTTAGEQLSLNLTTIYFTANSSELSEAGKKELEKAASSIKSYLAKSTLIVKGYAAPDEQGNLILLSRNRALEVKKYLLKSLGVPPSGIFALGYSTKDSVKSGTPTTKTENQARAVITISTQP